MAFKRFFGRGRDAAACIDAPTSRRRSRRGPSTDDEPSSRPRIAPERSWRERAEAVLPTGASTGSKRAAALYGDALIAELADALRRIRAGAASPTSTATSTSTARWRSARSRSATPSRASRRPSIDAATQGNVGGLSSWREVELAERLCAIIPCAERVQFLKTGAEATAAAVRIARTYTGARARHRVRLLRLARLVRPSRPACRAGARRDVTRVPFDDVAALERAVAAAGRRSRGDRARAGRRAPAVDRMAAPRARELCDAGGAVLIFDEIKTGFRLAPGGYQEVCGVTPDLAAFGKAMANGYPLAAVVGDSALMDAARETWISSTLASESTALAAALAVLDWHDEADICATLAETGREMRAAVRSRDRRERRRRRRDGRHRSDVAAATGTIRRARRAFFGMRCADGRAVQARRVQLCRARARRGGHPRHRGGGERRARRARARTSA